MASKRKPIVLVGERGMETHIQWVGPPSVDKQYIGYLRIEVGGEYAGSPTDRQLRKLKQWLDDYFGVRRGK